MFPVIRSFDEVASRALRILTMSPQSRQVLVTVLKQGQELLTEPGSLLSMSSFIQPDIKYDAQEGCKRSCCAGESCFQVRYTCASSHPKR
jgi:uncharacterized protein (AIM24 family)